MPNATSGSGTITCETYNGGTLVGTKSVGFTATVPGSIVPSISLSNPTIGGSAPAGWGIFVKGKSTVNYIITGTGNQGSTISQYQSSVAGYSYTTPNVTTGILYSAGTQTISAKVIDSRGRQATTSKTFNVVDYYNPSFTAVQIQRVDQNGNLDDNGEYAYFHFAGSVSSCSGNNKGTFKIAYREHNTGSYTEKTIATNQESINQSGFITSDGTQSGTKIEFENTNTYDIKFMITDTFITVENLQQLDTGFDLLNWNTNGKAMAIGKVSEAEANEELLETGIPLKICDGIKYVELTNENILTLKPGYYFKEGSTGWTENGWPITTWHCTLKVSGTAYDDNNGYRVLEVITTSNQVYRKVQSWGSWSDWYLLEGYSTNEIPIGTWIDGKTLYRKVVQIPQFNTAGVTVQTGITNTDFIMMHGSLTRTETGHVYSIDNYLMEECRFNPANGNLQLWSNVSGVSFAGYIIFEYTKN